MRHLLTSSSAMTLVLAALPAAAQDTLDLGEISIFVNRGEIATPLERSGASVEVVTGEDLAESPNGARAADALNALPGVNAASNGGLGAATALRIRGLGAQYQKVLVDGIDVTDPTGTQDLYDFGQLTTSGLGRIEILKGSSSALYGSRAIGGVINITTPRATEEGATARLMAEIGTYDTYRLGGSVAHRGARGGLAFTFDHVETEGFSSSAFGTEDDGFTGTRYSFSGDIAATDRLTLGLTGFYETAEGAFDEFGGDGAAPFDETYQKDTTGLRAHAELQTGALSHTVSASWFEIDRDSSSNGFTTVFTGDRERIDYAGTWTARDDLILNFGADYQEESFNSGFDAGDRDLWGIYGEALWAATPDVDIAASLRYDDFSDFGDNLSGRLAGVWRPGGGDTILRAVVATGFRAPSLYELNSTLYGNAALRPEESISYELGVEQRFGNGDSFVKATLFRTEVEDLIQFVTLTFVPFTGQYRQAPGKSTSEGIELSGQWAFNDTLSLFGNYTYTSAEDPAGARLLRVPRHDFVLGLNAALANGLSGALTLQHVADLPDEFGTPLPDYTVVNASLGYAITDTAQAYLRIENLLDEDYQTAANFNMPGRSVAFGLRADF